MTKHGQPNYMNGAYKSIREKSNHPIWKLVREHEQKMKYRWLLNIWKDAQSHSKKKMPVSLKSDAIRLPPSESLGIYNIVKFQEAATLKCCW